MWRKTGAIALPLALSAALGACSTTGSVPSIRDRQGIQRGNIREGAREGDLTRREAGKLRARSRDIAEDRRDAISSGGIDQRERRELKERQQNLGKDIYRKRHNKKRR